MRTRGGIPPASIIRLRFSSRPAILHMVAAALACRSGEAFCINEMRGGMAPAVATASCASSSFTAKLCNAPERDRDKQQARGWVSHSHICKSVSLSHVCNISHGTCAIPPANTHTTHHVHKTHARRRIKRHTHRSECTCCSRASLYVISATCRVPSSNWQHQVK